MDCWGAFENWWLPVFGLSISVGAGAIQWEKDTSWGGRTDLRREKEGRWIRSWICWVWGDCRTSRCLVGGWIYRSYPREKILNGEGGSKRDRQTDWFEL